MRVSVLCSGLTVSGILGMGTGVGPLCRGLHLREVQKDPEPVPRLGLEVWAPRGKGVTWSLPAASKWRESNWRCPGDCSDLAGNTFKGPSDSSSPERCASEKSSQYSGGQQVLVSFHKQKRMAWPSVASGWDREEQGPLFPSAGPVRGSRHSGQADSTGSISRGLSVNMCSLCI